ncbi:MAG TPA: hypothetical protein VEH06_07270 [Candidatus Bathyarchaeia archaeon]|nr:hypothetical protein [Candidatus Bathyarchaeia archaeon]
MLSQDTDSVKCALCGKTIASMNEIAEMVDNETYTFDGTDCVMMFKKARSVYGTFFDTW